MPSRATQRNAARERGGRDISFAHVGRRECTEYTRGKYSFFSGCDTHDDPLVYIGKG